MRKHIKALFKGALFSTLVTSIVFITVLFMYYRLNTLEQAKKKSKKKDFKIKQKERATPLT